MKTLTKPKKLKLPGMPGEKITINGLSGSSSLTPRVRTTEIDMAAATASAYSPDRHAGQDLFDHLKITLGIQEEEEDLGG